MLKFFNRYLNSQVNSGLIFLMLAILTTGCFNSKVKFFRQTFDLMGENMNNDLEKHIPGPVSSDTNITYLPGDPDAKLDIYYSIESVTTRQDRPVIFWIHGGGWMAGRKEQISNYAKILSHNGYTVITVEYSLAPESTYPTPLHQVNAALKYLLQNAERHRINMNRVVIAGDSGGAQIAAQSGIILTDPSYSKKLGIKPGLPAENITAMILHCGTYDFNMAEKGKEGVVLRMMMRAYYGSKKYLIVSLFALGSVSHHIPATYPPAFISTGNSDPLKKHSYALADTLIAKGIRTDTLFWESNSEFSTGHEYQFNLDDEPGKIALDRTLRFLESFDRTDIGTN